MRKLNKAIFLIFLLGLCNVAFAASLGTGRLKAAFSKGETSVSIVASTARAFNDDYIVLGVGVGYYVLDGLELGIDAQHWFSGEPSITKVSPQIKYVYTQSKAIKPYVGAFYRTTFIENNDSEGSYGGRVGTFFSNNNGVHFGAGLVYEKYQDCSRVVDCSSTYPEVNVSVSF